MKPEDVPDDLLDLACDQFFGTPPEPGDDRQGMANAIAAVIPAIREQAIASARAEIAKLRDDQTYDDELSATARVAYTVALNVLDRIARGDQ